MIPDQLWFMKTMPLETITGDDTLIVGISTQYVTITGVVPILV
jgi:hypothetical protein